MENKTFLQILRDEFSEKKDDEILVGDKQNIVIPIEWMFTESLDRDVIERAMSGLLKNSNLDYMEKMQYLERSPNKIKEMVIKINEESTELVIKGGDDWTKAIITSDSKAVERCKNVQYKKEILKVSEDDFFAEILATLRSEDISKICSRLELDEQARKNLETIFPIHDKLTVEGIKKSMAIAAKNLGDYYRYLNEEKRNAKIYYGVIKQRIDKKPESVKATGKEKNDRKNEIYPFRDRARVLENMNPNATIHIDQRDEDGNLIPNSYTVYMYSDARNKDDLIFVSEPLEGSHYTRIVAMTKEEYDGFKVEEDKDKIVEVARRYLEMSVNEFNNEKNTVELKHTDMETYEEKLRYVVANENLVKTKKYEWYYKSIIRKLYGKEQFTKQDIAEITKEVPMSKVSAKIKETEKIQGE